MRLRWIVVVDTTANAPGEVSNQSLLSLSDARVGSGATPSEAARALADELDARAQGSLAAAGEYLAMRAELVRESGTDA